MTKVLSAPTDLPRARAPRASDKHDVHATLERARRAMTILDVVALTDTLADAAAAVGSVGGTSALLAAGALVEATHQDSDAPTSIAAVHALARLPRSAFLERFRELLEEDGWLAPHAAWAMADQPPEPGLVEPLVEMVARGRLGGMLAQQCLAHWASHTPDVRMAVSRSLDATKTPVGRARLVEMLGLVWGGTEQLVLIAHESEALEVRSAAIAALGDRPGAARSDLAAIAAAGGPEADVARLALVDQRIALDPDVYLRGRSHQPGRAAGGVVQGRLRIAQVHLAGQLDHALAHVGEGSTGGVATLLVQLGDALTRDPRVAGVTTIGRGSAADALIGLHDSVTRSVPPNDAHVVLPAPLGRHEGALFADPWPAAVAAERGIRRILATHPADLLHLRMADVGSLAASRVARRRGLPIIFTLAPDPHAIIAEMERAGAVDRASFGPADAAGALWYRMRLVRQLGDTAQRLILFPRAGLATRLRDLLGIDITAAPSRYHVVPEGIDLEPVRAARREVAGFASRGPRINATPDTPSEPLIPVAVRRDLSDVLGDLRSAVAGLGDRRGLPLVVSVGRFAEVKGMARLVEAFVSSPTLRRRANLVLVGGNLADPTPDELAEIERIEEVFERTPDTVRGLVMLGHRPHDDVLRVLAAAEAGLAPDIAPGGAYACASRKEEFGLAIVEALGVGLPVVAPRDGGPSSYIEEGVTGLLVDTLDRSALAAAISEALDLARRPDRSTRARSLVEQRFSIRAMSDALIPVYDAARGAATLRPTA